MLSPDAKAGTVNLTCLKNRHGEPRSLELTFDGTLQRFETPDGWGDSPPGDVSTLWDFSAGGDDYEH